MIRVRVKQKIWGGLISLFEHFAMLPQALFFRSSLVTHTRAAEVMP